MTFIFDEKTGVGGKAAVELGARGQTRPIRAGSGRHAPTQVASWADAIAKGENQDGSIATTISQVRGDERVHEIARTVRQRKNISGRTAQIVGA